MAGENQKPLRVLFLCAGNSARSVFAEYFMNKIGKGKFQAYSAGSDPKAAVNPYTVRVLKEFYGIDPRGARSKSWDEFKDSEFDVVITVCDKAKESCPIFPGKPVVAHWGIPDPALAADGDEQKLRAFKDAAQRLHRRIELLCAVPKEKLAEFLASSVQEEKAVNS